MAVTYQVTARYITAKVPTEYGPQISSFSQHMILPPGVPQAQLDHLLSVGMIVPVTVGAPPAPEPEEVPETAGGEPGNEDTNTYTDESKDGPAAEAKRSADESKPDDPDADKQWAEAMAKAQTLVDAGSKPDGRSNPLVIAAFLVGKGYDRAAVEKADKKDLLDLVNGLDG